MKRFFAFAVIALMCLPAFVSCKKDKTSSTNFLKIDGEEQKIISAEFLDEPDEYFLIMHTEGNLGFDFELSKANKGEKRKTAEEFAKSNPKGRFILGLASHLCAVVDGKIRDGWNCGYKCIYKIYIINEK
jgi:hypothetical protein